MKPSDIGYCIAVIALLAGSIFAWTSAPCGLWAYSKAGDMPARCLTK
ncbi:hypothetical protein SEA_CAELUM_34 [Streptomyces phage Caelum]|uniref:Uncharacterized protein n=1 Tax=Streptomyces phage Caelum TaxID=2530160 RepID=A0A481W055_9CAUD|nr:hypothetical protein KGG86_gp34 [Streptomyces phage Caelum]QBI99395.1 hypothetical protein SEA_CAELUM_34 [Streptomyces phage Caelum]